MYVVCQVFDLPMFRTSATQSNGSAVTHVDSKTDPYDALLCLWPIALTQPRAWMPTQAEYQDGSQVKLCDVGPWRCVRNFEIEASLDDNEYTFVDEWELSPDGRMLAAIYIIDGGSERVRSELWIWSTDQKDWDKPTNGLLHVFPVVYHCHHGMICWSPDNTLLVTRCLDSPAVWSVWSTVGWSPLCSIPIQPKYNDNADGYLYNCTFSPDSKALITGFYSDNPDDPDGDRDGPETPMSFI